MLSRDAARHRRTMALMAVLLAVALLGLLWIMLASKSHIEISGANAGSNEHPAGAGAQPTATQAVVSQLPPTSAPTAPPSTPTIAAPTTAPIQQPPPAAPAPPAPPTATAQPAQLTQPQAPPSPTGKPAQPSPTPPKAAAKPAQPAPAKPTATRKPGPPVLPNGVVYGTRKPNLPNRIVRIASPNVKLDTSVYEVYSPNGVWEVADYAAGHHFNSKNPGEGGNIVLSGHNNWRGEVFRYLEFLKPGDIIKLWTLDGKEYDYKVQQILKLQEAGASLAQRLQNGKVMDPTPYERLTLITCWPYTTYTHRLIVIATPTPVQ